MGNNYLINGFLKGLNSFSTGILILVPVAAGLAIAYQQIMKMFDEDDGMVSIRNRRSRTILFSAVIGETATALITMVTGWFQ